MEDLKTYNQFVDIINEELKQKQDFTNHKKVVMFSGRFQPLHNGHINAFKEAYKKFGVKVIPVQIISKNIKSPIPLDLLEKINKSIVEEFDFIESIEIYPPGTQTALFKQVQFLIDKKYYPIGLACGSDREKGYTNQIKYITGEKSEMYYEGDFEVKVVDIRDDDGPSGTKTREAIKNDDFESFKEMVPKSIHKYWGDLKKVFN